MKLASSSVSRPKAWRNTLRKYLGVVLRLKNTISIALISGGRGTAISGSRPTMIVSLWWRVWLHRQTVASRITMNEAIS